MGRVYLYAVTQRGHQTAPAVYGIDGASAVRLVTRDGLVGVVSNYDGLELPALPRPELVRRLLAHQQVVEHVMQHAAVLPVRFGTLLASTAEVRALLAQRRRELGEALAAMQDKVEFEVAARWDTAQVLQEIGREEGIVRVREALLREGRTAPADGIRLGRLVKARMDKRREDYQSRMVELLRPLALDVAVNPLIAEEMVMNVAFLLERSRQRAFEARVEELDECFQGRLQLRLIGPLPPYSFGTLVVTRVTAEELAQARQVLGLAEPITAAAVRQAYRRRAAAAQRNLLPGDAPAHEWSGRLRRASDLLLSACRARAHAAGAAGDTRGQPPSGRDAGRLFLVVLRRAGADEVESGRFGAAETV